METAIAKKEPTWIDYVNEVMPKFNEIAAQTKTVLWKAESQFAIQALQKNKGLSECVPYTVQNAVINIAAVGLTLNPADAYAYLVPEYNKQSRQKECQLRISFKGLIKVATDSGAISWVKAEIVKKEDTFEYKGISEPPSHVMTPFGERGDTVGVYCVAKTNDGEYLVDIISKAEIDQIRACAKTDAVWSQWYDEMAKKAVIKRASKQWPRTDKSSTLHKAVEVINESEGGDPNYLIYTPEQREEFNKLFDDQCALMFFSLGIRLGIRADRSSDVWQALVKASKDNVRAEKGATQRGKDIRDLYNKGFAEYGDVRDNILVLAEDNDAHAVQEQFDIVDSYELKEYMYSSFSEDEKEKLIKLKESL